MKYALTLALSLTLLLGGAGVTHAVYDGPAPTSAPTPINPIQCSGTNCAVTQDTSNPSPVTNPGNPSPVTNPGSPTTNTNTSGGGLMNPLSSGASLDSLLNSILGLVVQIGTVVVILMLVYVGFLFATAGGDSSQISKAREALTWTIVGALVLLGAQAIASGIQATVSALSGG